MTLQLRKDVKGAGRYDRFVAKQKVRAKANTEKRKVEQAAREEWKRTRLLVYLRDGKRDRAFGTPLLLETDNLVKRAEVHHIKYRSAGGTDDLSNLCLLSFASHRMEHNGELDISGDANKTLTFRQFKYEGGTRRFVREWESAI